MATRGTRWQRWSAIGGRSSFGDSPRCWKGRYEDEDTHADRHCEGLLSEGGLSPHQRLEETYVAVAREGSHQQEGGGQVQCLERPSQRLQSCAQAGEEDRPSVARHRLVARLLLDHHLQLRASAWWNEAE